jgi:HSP90 family molecular chaperone
LRELISNCADALNKIKIQNDSGGLLTNKNLKLQIRIIPDEDLDELTVWDTGIGMVY